ncbi:unnamed protein product [Durusdinium trenchii]|uniref:peptidylprolyl isomerase n=1 Tax=Durusdinium trenchii TaxID=1381693 RepID=A0ABP0SDM2_9DINO
MRIFICKGGCFPGSLALSRDLVLLVSRAPIRLADWLRRWSLYAPYASMLSAFLFVLSLQSHFASWFSCQETTSSGLAFRKIKPGTGKERPQLETNVTALYNGWASNGDLVLSTSFGAQDTFLVREVPIEGLKEALQLMVEGETRRFWIPGKLGFGATADESRGLPPGLLVFDVRLMSINS